MIKNKLPFDLICITTKDDVSGLIEVLSKIAKPRETGVILNELVRVHITIALFLMRNTELYRPSTERIFPNDD